MPETAVRPQNRAEGPCGGAGKHCYVKNGMPGGYGKKLCRRACAGENPAHTDPIPSPGIQAFSATARLRPPAGAFFCLNTGEPSCRHPRIRPERGPVYLPLTLAVPPIPFIIKPDRRRLRPATIKAKATENLFEPPARRFFLLFFRRYGVQAARSGRARFVPFASFSQAYR